MLVEFGNAAPTRTENKPAVTYINVPDEGYTYEVADSAADLARKVMVEIATAPDGKTRLPDQEAILAVVTAWRQESTEAPMWVWSDNNDFAVLLANFFDCPVGRPDDIEDAYHTKAGAPGVGPQNTDPDAEPIAAVLEGSDADKAQPPTEAATDTEVSS